MSLTLRQEQAGIIRQHGERDYPAECCGMLLGRAEGDQKEALEAVTLPNLRRDAARGESILPLEDAGRESERNRFLIDPRDQLRVEKDARRRGLEVVGYYHSHPDHPARPSPYDRAHAWPWYSYVILAVEHGDAKEMTSWVLAADRSRFEPEAMET